MFKLVVIIAAVGLTSLYLDSLVPQNVHNLRVQVIALNVLVVSATKVVEVLAPITDFGILDLLKVNPVNAVMKNEYMDAKDEIIEGVPTRIYTPHRLTSSSIMVYYHGGGFCACSVNSFNDVMIDIVKATGMKLIAVDYRLAPEHINPAAHDDCLKVTKHVLNNPDKFGYKPGQVYAAGDSAGGHITAVISQTLAEDEHAEHKLRATILIYPAVQMVTSSLPSYKTQSFALLTTSLKAKFLTAYLGLPSELYPLVERSQHVCYDSLAEQLLNQFLSERDLPTPYQPREKTTSQFLSHTRCNKTLYDQIKSGVLGPKLSPIFKEDLSKLPPTLVMLAEADILRDEGLLYAKRLKKAGVDTQLIMYKDAIHAFFSIAGKVFQRTHYTKAVKDISNFTQRCDLSVD